MLAAGGCDDAAADLSVTDKVKYAFEASAVLIEMGRR